jgi:hypothetical protein
MNNIDGYLEELIDELKITNKLLEEIAYRIRWIADER